MLGTLRWSNVDSTIVSYSVYYLKYTPTEVYYELLASDIKTTSYDIPDLPLQNTVFAVRGYRANGEYSDITESDSVYLTETKSSIITASASELVKDEAGVLAPTTITFTTSVTAGVHKWIVNGVIKTQTGNSLTINTFDNELTVTVYVTNGTNLRVTDTIVIPYSQAPSLAFVSNVFKRYQTQPTAPTGGTFSAPVPSGWADGIPANDTNNYPVWMSVRKFTSDNQESAWSTPTQLTSNTTTKFEFSVDSSSWHDVATTNDVYLRTTINKDGTNTTNIVKIKGEKGVDGVSIKGDTGDSSVRIYRVVTTSTADLGAPDNGTTYPPATWYTTTQSVTPGYKQYQCDGIKNAISGYITWGTPYLSYFKVDTLDAFTLKTGSLYSNTTSGQRLSINEANSNEFRTYSANASLLNGIVTSMGDTGEGSWESLFYANLAASTSISRTNTKSIGLDVLLPPVSTVFPNGQWITALTTGSRFSNSLGLDGGLEVTLGTFGRYSGTGDGTVNARMGVSSYMTVPGGGYVDATLTYDHNDPPNSVGAGKFTYYTSTSQRDVVLCDVNYAIKTTGAKCLFSFNSLELLFFNSTYAIQAIGDFKLTGSISVSGNITAYDGSDKRIKEDIKPIQNALSKLQKLSGNTFKWIKSYYDKQDKDLFKEHDVGVIAQEIEAVLPEAVLERSDGVLAVNYVKIIPLLIEAIKEQQVQIEELRNDITRLSK
jgi:hypothetical protein